MGIDGASTSAGVGGVAPDVAEQLLLADDAFGFASEPVQQGELELGQSESLGGVGRLMALRVDVQEDVPFAVELGGGGPW